MLMIDIIYGEINDNINRNYITIIG